MFSFYLFTLDSSTKRFEVKSECIKTGCNQTEQGNKKPFADNWKHDFKSKYLMVKIVDLNSNFSSAW